MSDWDDEEIGVTTEQLKIVNFYSEGGVKEKVTNAFYEGMFLGAGTATIIIVFILKLNGA